MLIATEAIGVGGVDVLIRSGALAAYGFKEGHILGGEVAGTVAAVGDGVDASWIGRRVWAFTGLGGGYAEQAVAPVDGARPAAGEPVRRRRGDARQLRRRWPTSGCATPTSLPGETVLVRGAAGGIGIMTVQLAARGGAGAVAVTTSSAERGERLRELGATHVLDRAGDGGDGGSRGLRRHHRHRRRRGPAVVLRQAQPERPHGGRRRGRGPAAGRLRHGAVRGVPAVAVLRRPSARTPCPRPTGAP